jgi:hypothetical protein
VSPQNRCAEDCVWLGGMPGLDPGAVSTGNWRPRSSSVLLSFSTQTRFASVRGNGAGGSAVSARAEGRRRISAGKRREIGRAGAKAQWGIIRRTNNARCCGNSTDSHGVR